MHALRTDTKIGTTELAKRPEGLLAGSRRYIRTRVHKSLVMLLLPACAGTFVPAFDCFVALGIAADSSAASTPVEPAAVDFRPAAPSRAWKSIVLHHSATSGGSVESIDAVHRKKRDPAGRPWLGIGYHFVVGNGAPMADGEIRPTFRWQQQLAGAHAGNRDHNEHGIGICLIGNFEEQPPTERQLAALGELIRTLAKQYSIPRQRVVSHGDVQATQCPGRLLVVDELLRTAYSDHRGS
jgi:hypothetical protein